MRTIYDPSLNANIRLDTTGRIRGINYIHQFYKIEKLRGRKAATVYLYDVAAKFAIEPEELHNLEQSVSYFNPQVRNVEYHFSDEKVFFDMATYAYYQTFHNTPVWASGVTVTMKQASSSVVAATNTNERGIDAKMPSTKVIEHYLQLFARGEKIDGLPSQSDSPSIDGSDLLRDILGKAGNDSKGLDDKQSTPKLISGRFFVYRYDSEKRTTDHPDPVSGGHAPEQSLMQGGDKLFCGRPPSLLLQPVPPSIQDGGWYFTAELVFRLQSEGRRMNWRVLVDVETNAILYLRALTSEVNGLVFLYDPITSTGTATNTPDQSNIVLNPHRDDVVLPNLDAPVNGVQALEGSLITLSDIEIPTLDPPTQPTGSDFDYDVRTNEFTAVNAYYHNDRFFQLVENLGFPLATYFDGTTFPVEVDHRGMGNMINAHCIGDGDGIDHACYALADLTDTVNPIGIATDWRVVLHELAGHGILYDHVGSANFGFAHSAGDSFAIILSDPVSEWHNGAAIDRFLNFPFVPAVPRRSDRTIASGWGWGGTFDVGGYSSEQILSTTMFRTYRSIGGDSTSMERREFASRYMAYLMLRAVGTLTQISNPSSAALFLDALQTADAGNWTSEGVFGGAYGKVLTWAFEQQNLNNGAVPSVDVYIDDGRAGEYEYLPVHGETTTIWNRHHNDGLFEHQEPDINKTNFAYVKIMNRGTSVANNVIVKGYHCKSSLTPSSDMIWPNDLQPFTTAQLSAGTLQPNDTEEKIVGPFEWTPLICETGHDCMLMIVSATSDSSNADNFTATEAVEDWRLVPNDNNIAQRNVKTPPIAKLPKLFRALAWAFVIIVGGIMITPGGVTPIVINPVVRIVVGILLIALGVKGIIGMLGKRTQGQ